MPVWKNSQISLVSEEFSFPAGEGRGVRGSEVGGRVTASFMLDFGGCSAPWLCSRARWQDGVLVKCPECRCQVEPDEL